MIRQNVIGLLTVRQTMKRLRLMAVLAHPDDESLGVGGTLAKYASEGVEVFLVTATRGDSGRYRGFPSDDPQHPGPLALANIRETELRAAGSALGLSEVSLLGFRDQYLDRANPHEAITAIVQHIRRVHPQVVVTFGPEGAYGHPDHVAISQFTTAAVMAALTRCFDVKVSKVVSPMGCRSFITSRGRNPHGKVTKLHSEN